MKFPLSKINEKEYQDKIYKLIKDSDCHVYIDTNIIALFYGIHDSARKEFFDWLKELVLEKRLNVPTWVVNEYTNRFIRNKIQDYLSPLKKVSTLKKEFVQISAFLKMHIEDSNLPQQKYASLADFQNDLNVIEEKIEKIAFTAQNKDEKYKLKIHDEINQVLETCIMDSDIDAILEKINKLGLIRYYHKLPPGFEDDKKDLNAHGDLILWYEILAHCKSKDIKKAILITNDEKKDWVYAPNKLIIDSREVGNTKLKLADPRLVHEFKTETDSEEFYIITFELLTKILINNLSSSFSNLASALQLVHNQTTEITQEESSESDQSCVNENSETDNAEFDSLQTEQVEITAGEVESHELKVKTTVNKELQIVYNKEALADRDFPLSDKSYFTRVIEQLKSHNWYIQNPCIDELLKFDSSKVVESISNNDKIFVIGRNIYQSACGGSASAFEFIQNLRKRLTLYNNYFVVHLYSGILYEIYFDSSNTFRGDNLKSYHINAVLEVLDVARLKPALEFIENSLKPYESNLLFLPYKNETVKLEVVFIKELGETKDAWTDEIIRYLKLESVKCDGRELLTIDPEKGLDIYYPSINLSGLVDLVCKTYGIPSNRVETIVLPEIDKTMQIKMGDKKLAIIHRTSCGRHDPA